MFVMCQGNTAVQYKIIHHVPEAFFRSASSQTHFQTSQTSTLYYYMRFTDGETEAEGRDSLETR